MAGLSLEKTKKKEYAWTDNPSDDIWRGGPCDSIEECIKEAIALGDYKAGDTIAVGLVEKYVPKYVDTDRLIEGLQEAAADEVGEVAEDWLWDIEKEDRKVLDERLLNTVLEWLKEYKYEPTFYKVHPLAEPVVVTIKGADQQEAQMGDGDGA